MNESSLADAKVPDLSRGERPAEVAAGSCIGSSGGGARRPGRLGLAGTSLLASILYRPGPRPFELDSVGHLRRDSVHGDSGPPAAPVAARWRRPTVDHVHGGNHLCQQRHLGLHPDRGDPDERRLLVPVLRPPGADRSLAGWVLAISGVISTVTFALIVAVGAMLTGNAVAAVVGALAALATVVPVLVVPDSPAPRPAPCSTGDGRCPGSSAGPTSHTPTPRRPPGVDRRHHGAHRGVAAAGAGLGVRVLHGHPELGGRHRLSGPGHHGHRRPGSLVWLDPGLERPRGRRQFRHHPRGSGPGRGRPGRRARRRWCSRPAGGGGGAGLPAHQLLVDRRRGLGALLDDSKVGAPTTIGLEVSRSQAARTTAVLVDADPGSSSDPVICADTRRVPYLTVLLTPGDACRSPGGTSKHALGVARPGRS